MSMVETADQQETTLKDLRNDLDNLRLEKARKDKLDYLADATTTIYQEILAVIDPSFQFTNWELFSRLLEEEGVQMWTEDRLDISYIDWEKDAETLAKYKYHNIVLEALEELDIPLAHFNDMQRLKKERNSGRHIKFRSRRGARNDPLSRDKIKQAREDYNYMWCHDQEVDPVFTFAIDWLEKREKENKSL